MNSSNKNIYKINKILKQKIGKDNFDYILSIYKKQKAATLINLFFEKINCHNKKYNTNFIKAQYDKYEYITCHDCNKKFTILKKKIYICKRDACGDSAIGYGNCCYKYCCPEGCLRKLNCGHYNLIEPDDLPYSDGFVYCKICNEKDKLMYYWNGESIEVYKKKYGF